MEKPTEHVTMIRESVPGERNSEKYRMRAVCSCGWEGNLWKMKAFARNEAQQHERFPDGGRFDEED